MPGGQGRSLEIELPVELDRPDVGSSGSSKSTTHEPIDTKDVTQWLGPKSREYQVDGAIFPVDESTLEQYITVPRIKARLPDRGTLDVIVTDYDISPTRTRFSQPDGPDRFLKEFSLTLTEFNPTESIDRSSSGGGGSGGGGGSDPSQGDFSDTSPYDDDTNQAPDTPSSF